MTRSDKTTYLFASIMLGLALAMHFSWGYVGDKNWLIYATRLVLSGEKLYVDVFETNPPLIIGIYSLPVYVAMHGGILEDYQWLMLLGFGVVALSLTVSLQYIKHHPFFAGDNRKVIQFGLLFGLVFVVLTSPIYFFDREHIFLLATFPYLLRYMPSLARRRFPLWLRVVTGVMAGIGFCIKPHTLVVFAGLQLFYLLRERRAAILYSLENSIIYVCALVYLSAVAVFLPDYYTVLLPMLMATYSGYHRPEAGLYFVAGAMFTCALTFVDFRIRYASPIRKDIYYLLGICVLMLCYALLNNGWGYTYNPLTSMLLITNGFVLWEYRYLYRQYNEKNLPAQSFAQGAHACQFNFIAMAVLCVLFFTHTSAYRCDVQHACQDVERLVQEIKEQHARSFGMMVMDFHYSPRLFRETGANLQTRFHHLWMLPKWVTSDADFAHTHVWILRYLSQGMATDLNTHRPSLVIVENSPEFYYTQHYIHVPDLLSSNTDFRQAWNHYKRIDIINECETAQHPNLKTGCRFDIYKRTD